MLVLAAGMTLQVMHNHSATGRWTELPYQFHEKQYAIAPNFMWATPNTPTQPYHYDSIRQVYETLAMDNYREAHTVLGYVERWGRRILHIVPGWSIFGILPFFCLWIQPRPRLYIVLGLMFGIQFVLHSFVPAVMSHYVAPLVPIAVIFTGVALRWLKNQIDQARGAHATHTLGHGSGFVLALVALQTIALAVTWSPHFVNPIHWSQRRTQMLSQLQQDSRPSIVFVKYNPEHNAEVEWIYNGADLATSKVLWAHDRGPELNAKVSKCYPGRQAWLLQPDEPDSPLVAYPGLEG
ncbi:MAG: hypothetical protein O3C60_09135 [Planctomycetota bacterium]|nr:hypothetical protein [Planctomycetota bacterium]